MTDNLSINTDNCPDELLHDEQIMLRFVSAHIDALNSSLEAWGKPFFITAELFHDNVLHFEEDDAEAFLSTKAHDGNIHLEWEPIGDGSQMFAQCGTALYWISHVGGEFMAEKRAPGPDGEYECQLLSANPSLEHVKQFCETALRFARKDTQL
jgi:hypothetical protein